MNANLDAHSLLRSALYITLLVQERWSGLNVSHKLAGAASAAVLCGAFFAGHIATSHVRKAVVGEAAASTALYMDSFISPHVQELADAAVLSETSRKALAGLLTPTAIGKPIVGFRIWTDQRIVFTNDPNLSGKRFAPSPARNWAWAGNVYVDPSLDTLDGDDDEEVRALGVPILEVYAPVHQSGTGRIIALVETYQLAGKLNLEIWTAQALIWTVLGLGTAAISALSFAAAHSGGNNSLSRITKANQRVMEMSELHMRQVGTELHDGPMQLVAMALLRLDSLHEQVSKLNGAQQPYRLEIERIRSALALALDGIRGLTSSLVPSKVKALSLTDTIQMAVHRYGERTGNPLDCRIDLPAADIPFSLKACIYRFVHDGLSNYSNKYNWHAVYAIFEDNAVTVSILGNPAVADLDKLARDPLLDGLRDRVEALGGRLYIHTGRGAFSITAWFSCNVVDNLNG